MTINAGSTYFLAFMFISEGDKLSITILIALREDNIEWKEKKKQKPPTNWLWKPTAFLCPILTTK